MRLVNLKVAAVALACTALSARADEGMTFKFGYSPNEKYSWASPRSAVGAYDVLATSIDRYFGHSPLARGTTMVLDEFVGFHLSQFGHEYGGHAEAFYETTGRTASVTLGLFNQSHTDAWIDGNDREALRKFCNEGGRVILTVAGLNYQMHVGELLSRRMLGKEVYAREHLMRLTNDLALLAYMIPTARPHGSTAAAKGDLTDFMGSVTGPQLHRVNRLYNQLYAGAAWQALGSWVDFYGAGIYLLYGDRLVMPRNWVRPETILTPYGVEYGLMASFLDIPGLGESAMHFFVGGGESLSADSKNMLRMKTELDGFVLPNIGTKVSLGVEYYRNSAEGFAFRAEAIQPLTKRVGLGFEARVKPFRGFSADFVTLPNQAWSARYTVLLAVTP